MVFLKLRLTYLTCVFFLSDTVSKLKIIPLNIQDKEKQHLFFFFFFYKNLDCPCECYCRHIIFFIEIVTWR